MRYGPTTSPHNGNGNNTRETSLALALPDSGAFAKGQRALSDATETHDFASFFLGIDICTYPIGDEMGRNGADGLCPSVVVDRVFFSFLWPVIGAGGEGDVMGDDVGRDIETRMIGRKDT